MSSSTTFRLEKHAKFAGRPGPVVLIILDGVGLGEDYPGNAFIKANPKNLNQLMETAKKQGLFTAIKAHGPAVGLPSEEDMGNSEVGHNAMGAGQIYSQGAKLVNESIESGRIFNTEIWKNLVVGTGKKGKTVHLLGLLSDGNVHSHINQLFKILDGIAASGVTRVRVHPLLDGRDVPPDSGLEFIDRLEAKLKSLQKEKGIDAAIGSGGGRMYVTMDRYESNWQIVKRGWDAHVRGVVDPVDITADYPGYFLSARAAIECARKIYPDKQDQYNPPFVIVDKSGNPIGKMVEGDLMINFNFRGDRAIEITKAFVQADFKAFDRVEVPKVNYAGLLEYDTEDHIPPTYLVPPPEIQNTSAQFLCGMGIRSFAIAETHKYGHVTYFWNGNKSGYVDEKLEKYIEIKSDSNEMIEGHPEMKAKEVTVELIKAIESNKYKFIRVNYANGDMVGHTGNMNSCIKSVQVLDEEVPKVVAEVMKKQGIVIITADHGNVEEKLDKKGKVKTSHTLNPVAFYIIDSHYKNEYKVETAGIKEPGIANVAATFMNLLGFEAPSFYEKSLIRFN
jgi:2,3-bisphosphoglycerate-independent phosphoglycerate mutase